MIDGDGLKMFFVPIHVGQNGVQATVNCWNMAGSIFLSR